MLGRACGVCILTFLIGFFCFGTEPQPCNYGILTRFALDLHSGAAPSRFGHLSDPNLNYLNIWRSKVNPSNKPLRMIYGGMGPDVTTPLLVGNATSITGIDLYPYDADRLRFYIDHWDSVDSDTRSLPPLDPDGVLPRRYQIKDRPLPADLIHNDLLNSIEVRRVRGYWDNNILLVWTHERLLTLELKKMGVDPKTVLVERDASGLHLWFDWGNSALGIPNSRRQVTFVKADVEHFFVKPPGTDGVKKADVYLQKSIPVPEVMDETGLAETPRWLNPGGKILFTSSSARQTDNRRNAYIEEKTRFRVIPADQASTLAMESYVANENEKFNEGRWDITGPWRYGWEITALEAP